MILQPRTNKIKEGVLCNVAAFVVTITQNVSCFQILQEIPARPSGKGTLETK
jgi:hypothetical protein